ncbi:MAG: histidine phosphatase family protein [Vulcanimicrobiota bacterium]
MMTLCIVRHGETDWNRLGRFQGREDIELNENGRAQASLIAEYLSGFQWDVIITSPLKRAYATAEIIGKKLDITAIIEDRAFVERDFGNGSGLTLEQMKSAYPDGTIPGRENDESLEKRVLQGLRGVADTYRDRRIVMVAHGAVINSLLKVVSAGKVNLGETSIRNACINILEHEGSSWQIKVHNSVDYLKNSDRLEY